MCMAARVPQKGLPTIAVECMHAWPVHGERAARAARTGAAHVLLGPANISMKPMALASGRWRAAR